jgi:hypothetical protein
MSWRLSISELAAVMVADWPAPRVAPPPWRLAGWVVPHGAAGAG